MAKMVSYGRNKIRKETPNKAVRKAKAEKNIKEQGRHSSKTLNKSIKRMYS